MLNQDFIAGIERGRQNQEVGQRCTVSSDDTIGGDFALFSDRLLQRLVAVVAWPINLQVLDLRRQIRKRITGQATVCKIVRGV